MQHPAKCDLRTSASSINTSLEQPLGAWTSRYSDKRFYAADNNPPRHGCNWLCGAWAPVFCRMWEVFTSSPESANYILFFFNIKVVREEKTPWGKDSRKCNIVEGRIGGRDAGKKCVFAQCDPWVRQSEGFFCIDCCSCSKSELAWYSVALSIRTASTGRCKRLKITNVHFIIAY